MGWQYYTTFIATMRREWAGIDHLRLDKFLMLVRRFFAAALRQLQANAWCVECAGGEGRAVADGRGCMSCVVELHVASLAC